MKLQLRTAKEDQEQAKSKAADELALEESVMNRVKLVLSKIVED